MTQKVRPLYLAEQDEEIFQVERGNASLVCIGDSITGWNNQGPAKYWPYETYPGFLQGLLPNERIANCGMAGDFSGDGLAIVENLLQLFPESKRFIIGYGTNDLGMQLDLATTSRNIIKNLDLVRQRVLLQGKQPLLMNVPYINESAMPRDYLDGMRKTRRDYHNEKLRKYCQERNIPYIDICSKLQAIHFADALHPNEEGARIIAQEVFTHVKE